MFADGIRKEGLKILSEWQVAEGIDACMFYLTNQNHWGSEKRTKMLLEILGSYGTHATRTIPDLERLAADFADDEPGFPKHLSKQKAEDVRKTIEFLKNTDHSPKLINIF